MDFAPEAIVYDHADHNGEKKPINNPGRHICSRLNSPRGHKAGGYNHATRPTHKDNASRRSSSVQPIAPALLSTFEGAAVAVAQHHVGRIAAVKAAETVKTPIGSDLA
jgi:hypothetical protein